MFGVGDGGDGSSSDAISTADVISPWCFAKLVFVSGAAGTVIVGLRLFSCGDTGSIVSTGLDMSTIDVERSDRRSFLAMVLPALLSSLMGGVCSRDKSEGRTGTVAVTVLLFPVSVSNLDRSFMLPRVADVLKSAVLGSGISQGMQRQVKQ